MKRCPKCHQQFLSDLASCPYDGQPLQSFDNDPLIGQVLEGKYRLEQRIGVGGMATVYLATRLQIGDEVAIKVLNSDSLKSPLAVARFRREAQAAARIRHNSVVTIHDLGVLPAGNTFLVMEYIRGHSLRDELNKQRTLPIERAIRILSAVCGAVQAAHDAGIIHRDLKPENIMIERMRDGSETIKVVDFGVAELREHFISDALTKITEAGMMVGTPYYISPEQCRGEELDNRADIYSLGIILYETLTGSVPFPGKTLSAVIILHAVEPPPSIRNIRPDISETLEAVILRALAKDRSLRQATALELAKELEVVLAGGVLSEMRITGVGTQPTSSSERARVSGPLNTTRITNGPLPARKSGLLSYDNVTGLHSYPYFLQRLEEALLRCAQLGEQLAVVLFGVDRFKRINDSYGYLMGDLVLREIALSLNEKIPESALLCRSPGDGFVLMISAYMPEAVLELAERLTKQIAEKHFLTNEIAGGLMLSLSAGVAIYPEDSLTGNELFDAAQRALKQAKAQELPKVLRISSSPLNNILEPQVSFENFVGRKAELERLKKEFEQGMVGRGRPIFVIGDAGLGKTRLVEEFRHRLVSKDILFLQGRFYESGGAIPYKVFYDSLRGSIQYLIEHSLGDLQTTFGTLADRVINDFTVSDPLSLLLTHDNAYRGGAEQEKYRIFDYLTRLYVCLARLRPLMLFFDDLHWADELTLEFLSYLIRTAAGERIFLVATMREWEIANESNPVRSWLRQMSRYGSYEQIRLAPLGEDEISAILGLMFGYIDISKSMLARLSQETKGNPFYLVEIVRIFLEEGVIEWSGESWRCAEVEEIRLPNSIVDLVEAHLAKLPVEALDTFTQAAIIGDVFTFDVLAAVTELDEDRLLPIIEAGLREYILKEETGSREDRYSFYHTTVRKVLYERTSRRRRKRLHQQVGRKLEELYADRANKIAAELVYHYYHAEDYEHALRYAVEAGNLAWRALSISEAAKYYEWAEKSIQSLTASLKVTGLQAGNQVLQLAACGLQLEADRIAQYHLNYGQLLMHIGKHKRAETELRQTIELARQLRSLQLVGRAFTALGELYRQYGQLTRGLEYGEQGLAVLSSIEDCEWEVHALIVIGAAQEGLGHFSEAIENYQGAIALARKLGDRGNEANALWGLGLTHYQLGQYEKAQESALHSLNIVNRINDKVGQERCLNLIGLVMREIGQYNDALQNFERALQIARDLGYRLRETTILNNIGDNYRRQGRYQEANGYYQQALAMARETSDRAMEGMIMLNIGLVHQGQGEHEKALGVLGAVQRRLRDIGARPAELEALVSIADSQRILGHSTEASASYQYALELSRQSGSPVFEWRALYGLARCERMRGNGQSALKLLRASVEVIEMISSELSIYANRVSFLKDKQIVYNDLAELTVELSENGAER
ncbi:MAG: tetratricopeptide repeat protein [Acidobacteriota bacterium]